LFEQLVEFRKNLDIIEAMNQVNANGGMDDDG